MRIRDKRKLTRRVGRRRRSRHPASGIRHPASGIRHPASGIFWLFLILLSQHRFVQNGIRRLSPPSIPPPKR
ncbi:hypothetical protein DDU58_08990, partial [Salmonella enterica]|nr:hypothetical protein [Salmonella enterica]ECE5031588.1 hypothetical protein [Salmonella enterica]